MIIVEYIDLLSIGVRECNNIDYLLTYNEILKNFISNTKKDDLFNESYWDNQNVIYSRGLRMSELARTKSKIVLYDKDTQRYSFFNSALYEILNESKYMIDAGRVYDSYDSGLFIESNDDKFVSDLREYFIDYEKTYVKNIIEYMNNIKIFVDMIHTLNNTTSNTEFLEYLRSNIDICDDELKNTIDKFIEKNKKELDDTEVLNMHLDTDQELKKLLLFIIKKCREEEQNGVSK